MIFIKLTPVKDGECTIHVNPEHIALLQEAEDGEDGGTHFETIGGAFCNAVKETPEQIFKIISDAMNHARNRKLPGTGISYDEDWWKAKLDITKKVAVYWPGTDAVTVVDYYNTVSAANTAATANINGQRKPRVAINWWHSDFTHIKVGAWQHRDATEDLPAWLDEEPAS